MSICDYCKEESKYLFICSHCGKRYCKTHRYPDNHDCQEIDLLEGSEDAPSSQPSLQSDQFISSNSETHNSSEPYLYEEDLPSDPEAKAEEDQYDEIYDEPSEDISESTLTNNSGHTGIEWRKTIDQIKKIKTPLAIIVIASILTGALMGVLINPGESKDNLQQRYDALYEYYIQIQTQNQLINRLNEDKTLQISNLENELAQIREDLSNLQSYWETVFSDETQYEYPTTNQLKNWLIIDTTNQQTLSQEYTATQQAIQLSLMAKTQNWKLGVETIYGNFTDTALYTYNLVAIEPGIIVYINPQTDRVWWTAYYEEITSNSKWIIEDYSVFVTKVEAIINP
jgi:hypothetical protein